MGKSPGKWIKTLLFGKKSRSHANKGRDSGKPTNIQGFAEENDASTTAVSPPVISESMLVSSINSEVIQSTGKGTSNIDGNAVAETGTNTGHGQELTGYIASEDARGLTEEQAAIKAQAAFRGYLARRAFHALKGIIRLQALGRGYLVRRQAVITLSAMDGIIKLQALIRGVKVGRSTTDIMESKALDSFKRKFAKHAFACKLLSSSSQVKPLQVEYDQGDPNSVYSWLERWTVTSLRKPLSQPDELIYLKTQGKRTTYSMENESSKSKRYARRISSANTDSAHTNGISDFEKTKRSHRKVFNSVVEPVQEPQSELEKIKRNLRKISSSMTDALERPEVEAEKLDPSFQKVTSALSEIPYKETEAALEQKLDDSLLLTETKCDAENDPEPLEPEKDMLPNDGSLNEMQPLQQIENDSTLKLNGDLNSKEEEDNENQRNSKRRSSFSTKSEYAENGFANNPLLPSYMAATESAKAKLRGLTSPRFISDTLDKNGFTRRHSLPSANGKFISNSPHTHKVVQSNGKGEFRSDRSLLSSRGANERTIQVEWRR